MKMTSLRLLQLATVVLALVPLVTGVVGLMGIADPLYRALALPRDALLDGNMRFLSGAWFGVGVAALWLVPRIPSQTALFRALWGMIFLGGVGRVMSMLLVGIPPIPFVAFTVLEVVGAPLFIYWQHTVAAQEQSPLTTAS